MNAFEFASPASVEEAVQALAGSPSSEALSGGTDLLNRLKDYVSSPRRVVALKQVKGLLGIGAQGTNTVIGAGTTLADLIANPTIASTFPSIRQAALEVGTPQIRNMATLGGNLLQRPRCWYYRNGYGLLGGKKEGNSVVRELEGEYAPIPIDDETHLVRDGDNRYSAIFLTDGDALFVAPSSLAPALIALGAQAVVTGPGGQRVIPVADLYRVPKTNEERELTLAPGDVLVSVIVPNAGTKNASYEVRQKRSHDWPIVLASVSLTMNGSTVSKASIVLGSVAPIPYRSEAAEKAITGKEITLETAEAAGAAAVEAAKPLSMNAYKVHLAKVAVKRALLAAAGNRYWEV